MNAENGANEATGTGNLRKMLSNRLKKRKRLKNNHFNLNQGCKMMENRVTIQKKTQNNCWKIRLKSMSGSGYYSRLLKSQCLVEKVLKRRIAINSLNLQFAIKEVKQR